MVRVWVWVRMVRVLVWVRMVWVWVGSSFGSSGWLSRVRDWISGWFVLNRFGGARFGWNRLGIDGNIWGTGGGCRRGVRCCVKRKHMFIETNMASNVDSFSG